MTREELAKYLRTQGTSGLPDEQLVSEWLKRNPTYKVDDAQSAGGGFGSKMIPFTLRLLPAALTAEGGFIGAAGSAAGEAAAQTYEKFLGGGQDYRPSEIAAAGTIGAIPFGGPAKAGGLVAQSVKQGVKGAALGATSSAIESVVGKGEAPDIGDMVKSAVASGLFTGAAHGIFGKIAGAGGIKDSLDPLLQKKVPEQDLQDTIRQIKEGVNPKTKSAEFITPAGNVPPAGVRKAGDVPETLRTFESVKHLPEDVRPDFERLLDSSNFQRRGIQSNARTDALATREVVPLEQFKPGYAMNAEEAKAHDMAWQARSQEVIDLSKKITSGDYTPADMVAFQTKSAERDIIGLNRIGAVTEAGRLLQSLKKPAKVMALADSEFLDKLMQDPKFKGNTQKLAAAIAESAGNPEKQFKLLMQSRSNGFYELSNAYLYNTILSGIKTPIRKATADVMNLMGNLAAHPFAVGADVIRHQVTGAEREVFLGEMAPQLYGIIHALPDAMKELTYVMKNGYSMKNVEQYAEQGAGIVDRMHADLPGGYLTNFPLRNLKAVTAFFKELGTQQELYGSAYAMARKEGYKHPAQLVDRINKLITGTGPETDLLIQGAQKFGDRATFMDPSGPVLRWFLQGKQSLPKPAQLALTFIAPIVRLPGKVLQRGLETSPIGFMMAGASAGGREGAQALGRATMGSIALAPFMWLAASGRLSGTGPKSSQERAELQEKGWLPNAIKVGDTWFEYHLGQPFSTEMSIAANAFEAFRDSGKHTDADAEDWWSKSGEIFARSLNSVLDQSYFSSLAAFQRALQDPERYSQTFMRGIAQDLVPYAGLQRNITQAIDPVVRKPEGFTDSMKAIIPGLSTDVPARLDRFGEDVKRPGGPLQRGVNPMAISPERQWGQDPVADLLEKLGIQPAVPRASISRKGAEVQLSPEDKHVIEQAVGKERRILLEPKANRDATGDRTVSEKSTRESLRTATEQVYERAVRLVKKGQPITLDKLVKQPRTKAQFDTLFQAYQENNK